jgi:hypothetical protein
LLVLSGAAPAGAHGFGQRYDLPIPLSFYLWGAGAVVAFSFAVFALFLTGHWAERPLQQLRLPMHGIWQATGRWLAGTVRMFATVGFLMVVLAGIIGDPNPFRNIAPTMIWIVGWVGIAFLSACIGNVWQVLNPWDTLFRVVQTAHSRLGAGKLSPHRVYPAWLGAWPAFVFFVTFGWMELVWGGRNVPSDLAAALIVYSAMTWMAMLVFGREAWLEKGEVFNLVFGVFSRFAPLVTHCNGERAVEIRLPASGLLDDRPLHPSVIALALALLATVTFDGLLETPLWAQVDLAVLDAPADSFLWTGLGLREEQAIRLVRTVALPCFILLVAAAYLLVCWLMSLLSGSSARALSRRFVLSLVPIALAYHVAHYFSYLLIGGQYAIPLVSNPFGWGWDLFGTASYRVDIGLIGPRLQWQVAVIAVVLGHVIAVYVAHVTALRIFHTRRRALLSQIPMLLLMVGYTMCSLWILSQPIVETGAG